MYQPLVTIGVVSYCHEAYVVDALLSVLHQDYKNLEIFIIDDHSSDGSQGSIKDFITTHSLDWPVILNNQNEGFCRNLNKLLKKAKGDFLFILAGDDYMAPNRISSLVKRAGETGDCAVIYSDCEIVDEEKKLIADSFIRYYAPSKTYLPEGNVLQALIENNFICNTAVLMRSTSLREIGGFDEGMILEDYSTWLALADKGYQFSASREKTFSYRLLGHSTLRKMGVRYYEDIFTMMSRLIHRQEPALRKRLRKKLRFCCKHCYYHESMHVKEMFHFFFLHFGFDLKLYWLYGLYLLGIKGKYRNKLQPAFS
jgi:glycosyltransferase involved in cell wall biosynthesis